MLEIWSCNRINPSATHYVIVRDDLPLGFLAAQVVHAAGESSPGNIESGTNAVVLAVGSEPALLVIERALQRAGIRHVSVREPDPPYHGQLTAIGLCPVVDRSKVKPILSRLALLGRRERHAAAV
jgi:peptidyl-tRNA hydrolase